MGDRTLLSMLRCIRVMATETAETAWLSLLTFQLGTKESEVALPLVFLFSRCLPQRAAHSSRCFIYSGRRPGTTHSMVQVAAISRTQVRLFPPVPATGRPGDTSSYAVPPLSPGLCGSDRWMTSEPNLQGRCVCLL